MEALSSPLVLTGEPLLISTDLALQLQELLSGDLGQLRAAIGGMTRDGMQSPPMRMTDDGFAVISMLGPVSRYDSYVSWIMSFLFGVGCTTDSLIDQFQTAFNDPACRGIRFLPDGPGGDGAAICDLGDMIYQMRDVKPVVAYVDNLAASATYWPTAACNLVVLSDAAFVGSIGVVSLMRTGGADGLIEIVSSQSPNKRPDLSTAAGRSVHQQRVDSLADVFIGRMAKYRGVSVEKVESDFGQGGVLIGEKAVAAGMADMVGDSVAAFAALRELADNVGGNQQYWRGVSMAENTGGEPITSMDALAAAYPGLVAQIKADARAEGALSERGRIQKIDKLDTPNNRAIAGELITTAKWDGKTTSAELAEQILNASTEKTAATAQARQDDGKEVPVVKDQPGQQDAVTNDSISAQIAAMANENRGYPVGTLRK